MTSNQFFVKREKILFPRITLEGEEHHHLSRVLRKRPKEKIWLFDEEGVRYLAVIESVEMEKTVLMVLEKKTEEEPRISLTLGQALLRAKTMDLIVQKSTELGISCFIPVLASRSVSRFEEKAEKKLERWRKIAREAAKQSKRSQIPQFTAPQPLEDFVIERREERKFILSENRGTYLRDILTRDKVPAGSSVLILIGPEGGWTGDEENFALDNGFEAVSLGKNILRAETAALAAVALLSHFWNS